MLSSTYIALALAASTAAAPASSGLGPADIAGLGPEVSAAYPSAGLGYGTGIPGAGFGGLGGFGGFGGFGAPSYITSSGSQSQSSDAAGSSYNSSPFGTSASQYSSHQDSSSSYSNTQVIGAFNGIYSQLAQMQSLLASGSLSYQVAQQQMAQLASQFQGAFSLFPGCVSCFGAGGQGINSALSSLFSQYASTMSAYQSAFGNQFSSLVSPLAAMSSQFSSFFQSYASQSSSSISSILPSGFGNILGSTVPGALPTLSGLDFK